jgi:hypothetical protein
MSICEAAETAAAVVAAFIRKIRRVDFESCISLVSAERCRPPRLGRASDAF